MADTHGTRHVPDTEQARAGPFDGDDGTWLMQGEAAARTGFSVSAIRKWRRMGLVADRRRRSPTGLERVEVRLEDVLARAAQHQQAQHQQPERHPAPAGPGPLQAPPGTVVISLEDLEAVFDRMVSAERRAEEAEAVAEALRDQATYRVGQIAELRRQLQRAGLSHPKPAPPDDAAPPPVRPEARFPRPVRLTEPVPRLETPPTNGAHVHPRRHRAEELVDELRRIYARLDEYRRQPAVTADAERRHLQHLAEYDRALLAACRAVGIPTGLAEGEPVDAEARAALTRALARAGFDVRVGGPSDGNGRRPRLPVKRRF